MAHQTGIEQLTAVERVRVRFLVEEGKLSVLDLNDRLYGLGGIGYFAYRQVLREPYVRQGWESQLLNDPPHLLPQDHQKHVASSSAQAVRSLLVEQLRYSSPLEAILLFSVSSLSLAGVADRFIKVFMNVQRARILKSGADLYVSVASELSSGDHMLDYERELLKSAVDTVLKVETIEKLEAS